MHDIIDFRSDTMTLPTPAMRDAMARAEVGDAVWEEDPTVKRLEALAAERMGKEAGLYVTSGTQGNLVSVCSHTQPGQEVMSGELHVGSRSIFAAAGLETFATTSGSKGLQLYVPLNTAVDYVQTKTVSKGLAQRMEREHPGEVSLCVSHADPLQAAWVLLDDRPRIARETSRKQVGRAGRLEVELDGERIVSTRYIGVPSLKGSP